MTSHSVSENSRIGYKSDWAYQYVCFFNFLHLLGAVCIAPIVTANAYFATIVTANAYFATIETANAYFATIETANAYFTTIETANAYFTTMGRLTPVSQSWIYYSSMDHIVLIVLYFSIIDNEKREDDEDEEDEDEEEEEEDEEEENDEDNENDKE